MTSSAGGVGGPKGREEITGMDRERKTSKPGTGEGARKYTIIQESMSDLRKIFQKIGNMLLGRGLATDSEVAEKRLEKFDQEIAKVQGQLQEVQYCLSKKEIKNLSQLTAKIEKSTKELDRFAPGEVIRINNDIAAIRSAVDGLNVDNQKKVELSTFFKDLIQLDLKDRTGERTPFIGGNMGEKALGVINKWRTRTEKDIYAQDPKAMAEEARLILDAFQTQVKRAGLTEAEKRLNRRVIDDVNTLETSIEHMERYFGIYTPKAEREAAKKTEKPTSKAGAEVAKVRSSEKISESSSKEKIGQTLRALLDSVLAEEPYTFDIEDEDYNELVKFKEITATRQNLRRTNDSNFEAQATQAIELIEKVFKKHGQKLNPVDRGRIEVIRSRLPGLAGVEKRSEADQQKIEVIRAAQDLIEVAGRVKSLSPEELTDLDTWKALTEEDISSVRSVDLITLAMKLGDDLNKKEFKVKDPASNDFLKQLAAFRTALHTAREKLINSPDTDVTFKKK